MASDYDLGECNTNPSCLSFKCINFDDAGINYFGLNLFPCSRPPSLQVLLLNTNDLTAQVNVTVTNTTTGIPFTDDSLGTLTVVMEINADLTTIDVMVSISFIIIMYVGMYVILSMFSSSILKYSTLCSLPPLSPSSTPLSPPSSPPSPPSLPSHPSSPPSSLMKYRIGLIFGGSLVWQLLGQVHFGGHLYWR